MKNYLRWSSESGRSVKITLIILVFILNVLNPTLKAQDPPGCPVLGTPGITMDPLLIPKFVNPLPIPARIDATVGGNFDMTMGETTQDLLGLGYQTKVWGYGTTNGLFPVSYPGPTLVAQQGVPITAVFNNNLPATGHFLPVDPTLHIAHPMMPGMMMTTADIANWYANGNVPTVAHLHGGHTESASDGLPEAWYTQNFLETGPDFVKQKFTYHNDQEAGTLWYHDHALGITRLNVYAGLAGFYLLRDANENNLNATNVLPSGQYEIEIVIQDRLFDANGQLFWPAYPGETPYDDFIFGEGAILPPEDFPDGGPSALAEFFGNVILVNGKAWPKLDIEPRKYRFRLLNGSDSRFYVLSLDNGGTILQIGTDDGLIQTPVPLNELVIAPGERYDVVIDFSGYDPALGQAITMINSGPDEPYRSGIPGVDFEPACEESTGQIMQFVVNTPLSAIPNATVGIGTPLRAPITPLVPTVGVPVRKLVLFEGMDEYGRLQPLLGTLAEGSKTWFEPITENPMLNDVEEWEVYNATMDAHPIHLHLVAFQIKNREEFTPTYTITPKPQIQHKSLAGDPLTSPEVAASYGTGAIFSLDPATPFVAGTITDPAPHEQGWKDTFIVPPGQVGRIIARFDRPGAYVWHCHILSHEDHEMMRPFYVGNMPVQAGQFKKAGYTLSDPVPNPVFLGSLNPVNINLTIPEKLPVAYKIFDGMGNVVLSSDTRFFDAGINTISINPTIFTLPGTYIFTVYAGDFYGFTRIRVR